MTNINWKTAKNVQALGQSLGIANEALYEIAMLNLRLHLETIENNAKASAERNGKEYKPSKVYWEGLEQSIKQLYNVA